MNDHLGTPQKLLQQNGAIAWSASYQSFGLANINSNSTTDNPLRFPGQYLDSETSMHYNYFRNYDPKVGRYVQSDPIGLDGGVNTFAYIENNPLFWIDPYGLAGETKTLGGGTTVRVDKPHVPGQQEHAHVKTPKGEVVVNKDGTQSHKGKGKMQNLNKKVREYLKKRGYKNMCVACSLIPSEVLDRAECILYNNCEDDPFINHEC